MDLEKEVKELREKVAIYENSPYVDAYLGILKHIDACNKDLIDTPAGLRDEEDMKAFEKYEKYILKVDEYYDKLQYLRDKMNPKEIKEIDAKVAKSKTVAI